MVYNWFDFDVSLYGYDFLLESMFVQFLTFNSKHNNCTFLSRVLRLFDRIEWARTCFKVLIGWLKYIKTNNNWGLAYGFGFQLYKSLAFAR